MAIYLPPEDVVIEVKKPQQAAVTYSTVVQKETEQNGKDEKDADTN